MTKDPRDAAPRDPEDDEYLWSGRGPADPDVANLEEALGGLRSRRVFDAASLPTRPPTKVVRPAPVDGPPGGWVRRLWIAPLVAAAAVAAWWVLRTPEASDPGAVAETSATPSAERPGPASTSPPPATARSSEPAAPSCARGASGEGFEFELLEGEPARCGEGLAPTSGKLPTGVWLTTPPGARARLFVATLGQVDVLGGTRVRILATSEKEHRLELARGSIHAVIDAPPRLFFVQTRSALAIDLGCEYTLTIDDLGNGRLAVQTGFVELASPSLEEGVPTLSSLVPKGASAALIDGRGPGLPVWDREPEAVKAAARRMDADATDARALDELLLGLGSRDTLTLVHLLPRVPREGREKVLASLARVEPIAAELRARAVEGDAEAYGAIRARFEPRWFPKPRR
jgi:hypothetical protein